ncbi:hypothetical protein ABZX12_02805 [Kribbella sp. NPDC003505]|uniref:hypothetical protein n=1 Tax=Kribbella sp. NPDC003505 TaxID=3154448 RepID=UPI0033AD6A4E
MRFDYNVLSVDVDGVIDALAVHHAYVAGGHDGVNLRVARNTRLPDLEFLRDLPGLRYVEVTGPVADDTAALLIPGIREVFLLTRCKKALPDLSGSTVSKIGLDSRPGLEQVAAIGLDEFHVWGWRGTDFTFLGDQPGLRRLKVEATRQLVSLQGLQHCLRLEYVELLALRATGLAPLAQASRLQHLWIIGDRRITGQVTLDLADLADLAELRQIRITFGGTIATLAPLTGPIGRRLRDFRIRGTKVGDGDLSPLQSTHPAADVVGPDD